MTSGWAAWPIDPGDGIGIPLTPATHPALLTGCGLAALWSPREGVSRWMAPPGAVPPPHPQLHYPWVEGVEGAVVGPGYARRTLRFPGGAQLLEEVLARDGTQGLIFRWTLSRIPPGRDTIPLEGDVALKEGPASLAEGEGGVQLGLALEGEGESRLIRLLPGEPVAWMVGPGTGSAVQGRGSAATQARRRGSRGEMEPTPLRITARGVALAEALGPQVAEAVRALDDSALQEDADGVGLPPFLLGMEGGELILAHGTPLVELGLGALAVGRFSLARSILRTLLDSSAPPLLPALFLAGEWGGRTGDLHLLRELRPRLEALVEGLPTGMGGEPGTPPPHGRSFPGAAPVLEGLASAVEPLGDRGWTAQLRARAAGMRPGARGPVLPVLGSGATVGEDQPVLLPPLEAFGDLDAPGLLGRRFLQAARLLRVVSEGLLGVRPDASYGRVRLAPSLPPGWEGLEASGIQVGDTAIDLAVHRDAGAIRFTLTPSAGRIPLNLIFEPVVPVEGVGRILLSGEEVQVDILPGKGRTGIRFQFPLDERKVVTVRVDADEDRV